MLTATVYTPEVMDRDWAIWLLPPKETKERFPRLSHIWLDAGYSGKGKGQEWIKEEFGRTTQVVKSLPRRVIVLAHVDQAPPGLHCLAKA